MYTQPTKPHWGHALLSEKTVHFSHSLLSHISDHILGQNLEGVSYIEREHDGSIIVHIENSQQTDVVIQRLLHLCTNKYAYFETPKSNYKIPLVLRQSLLSWALAFEGCLGMLLLADKDLQGILKGNFEYINAKTGGLYLNPYTLFLNSDHPKIVHPITLQNMHERLRIEQKTAHYIRLMLKRMEEAHTGMEGIALLSLVQEKTQLKQGSITEFINEKSLYVPAPLYSPFFEGSHSN